MNISLRFFKLEFYGCKHYERLHSHFLRCRDRHALPCVLKERAPGNLDIYQIRSFRGTPNLQQIQVRKEKVEVNTKTTSEKAKQAAKDTSYGIVILAGVTCIGFVCYILYKELLSKAGPTQVFGDALEKCRENQDLAVALGSPVEGYGEMNSRGRRRHVSHLAYIDSHGRNAMRMKFYVKGSSGRTGTVQVDSVIVGRKISYRYIIAYLDIYPRRTIIVLDERSELDREGDEVKNFE